MATFRIAEPGFRAVPIRRAERLLPAVFVIPHGAPEGYEWLVALVVLVCLYFAVRKFIRSWRKK